MIEHFRKNSRWYTWKKWLDRMDGSKRKVRFYSGKFRICLASTHMQYPARMVRKLMRLPRSEPHEWWNNRI